MTFTGTATLSGTTSQWNIIQAINSYTTAQLIITDKSFSNIATLLANIKKSVIKTESVYSNVILRSEIEQMKVEYEQIEYELKDKSRKFLDQSADYDPRKETGFVRQLTGSTGATKLIDNLKSFGSGSELANHLVHYFKTDNSRVKVAPNDDGTNNIARNTSENNTGSGSDNPYMDDDGAATLAAENGDVHDLYQGIPNRIGVKGNNSYVRLEGHKDNDGFMYMLEFVVSLPSLATIILDDIKLTVMLSTRKLSAIGIVESTRDPYIGLWDYGNSRYEGKFIRGDDVAGRFTQRETDEDFTGESHKMCVWTESVLSWDEDLSENYTAYINELQDLGNLVVYNVRAIVGCRNAAGVVDKPLQLRYAFLEFEFAGDNLYVQNGVETISSHTDTELTFGNLGSLSEDPLYDGIGIDDGYFITDTLDNQISTLASQWGVTINTNITGDSELSLTADYSDISRYDLLQDICDLSNSVWWYDPDADAYNIVSADNLQSTGITITRDDVDNWQEPGSWHYKIDPEYIYSDLTIVGAANLGTKTVSLSPEFTPALGNEEKKIQRPDLRSYYAMSKYANAVKPVFANAHRQVQFTLDFSNPNQSYANLVIGKTIAVQWPTSSDTSICDFSTTGDGELLVSDMQFDKGTDGRLKVTVTAQRRYS